MSWISDVRITSTEYTPATSSTSNKKTYIVPRTCFGASDHYFSWQTKLYKKNNQWISSIKQTIEHTKTLPAETLEHLNTEQIDALSRRQLLKSTDEQIQALLSNSNCLPTHIDWIVRLYLDQKEIHRLHVIAKTLYDSLEAMKMNGIEAPQLLKGYAFAYGFQAGVSHTSQESLPSTLKELEHQDAKMGGGWEGHQFIQNLLQIFLKETENEEKKYLPYSLTKTIEAIFLPAGSTEEGWHWPLSQTDMESLTEIMKNGYLENEDLMRILKRVQLNPLLPYRNLLFNPDWLPTFLTIPKEYVQTVAKILDATMDDDFRGDPLENWTNLSEMMNSGWKVNLTDKELGPLWKALGTELPLVCSRTRMTYHCAMTSLISKTTSESIHNFIAGMSLSAQNDLITMSYHSNPHHQTFLQPLIQSKQATIAIVKDKSLKTFENRSLDAENEMVQVQSLVMNFEKKIQKGEGNILKFQRQRSLHQINNHHMLDSLKWLLSFNEHYRHKLDHLINGWKRKNTENYYPDITTPKLIKEGWKGQQALYFELASKLENKELSTEEAYKQLEKLLQELTKANENWIYTKERIDYPTPELNQKRLLKLKSLPTTSFCEELRHMAQATNEHLATLADEVILLDGSLKNFKASREKSFRSHLKKNGNISMSNYLQQLKKELEQIEENINTNQMTDSEIHSYLQTLNHSKKTLKTLMKVGQLFLHTAEWRCRIASSKSFFSPSLIPAIVNAVLSFSQDSHHSIVKRLKRLCPELLHETNELIKIRKLNRKIASINEWISGQGFANAKGDSSLWGLQKRLLQMESPTIPEDIETEPNVRLVEILAESFGINAEQDIKNLEIGLNSWTDFGKMALLNNNPLLPKDLETILHQIKTNEEALFHLLKLVKKRYGNGDNIRTLINSIDENS